MIARGTGPSWGCTWECVQGTLCRLPPSCPLPCQRASRAPCSPGTSHSLPTRSHWKWGTVLRASRAGGKHTFSHQQCLQIQRRCVQSLNCGLFRVNKGSTQQRMLLSSLKRRRMPPTAWKRALQATLASHPARSSWVKVRVREWKMGSQLSG